MTTKLARAKCTAHCTYNMLYTFVITISIMQKCDTRFFNLKFLPAKSFKVHCTKTQHETQLCNVLLLYVEIMFFKLLKQLPL